MQQTYGGEWPEPTCESFLFTRVHVVCLCQCKKNHQKEIFLLSKSIALQYRYIIAIDQAMDTWHIIPHERQLRQVWKSLTIQGLRHTPEGQEEQRVHKTLWCFYCKDDTTIRYTTDRLYVYNYYWTFSISNLLHCDESFQDEHYGNYGTWTSWTLAFSHVNPSQHATSDIFLPSKAFPFRFSKHDVWCTHLPWRHWLTPIMLPQCSRWVVGPSLLKCDPCYKLSAYSVSLTWNLPL